LSSLSSSSLSLLSHRRRCGDEAFPMTAVFGIALQRHRNAAISHNSMFHYHSCSDIWVVFQ
jgi:hypothetical protein